MALHGAIRGTIDIDLVIVHKLEQFVACEKALESIGYQSHLPVSAKDVFNFRREYIEKRDTIAWSFYSPSNPIDVIDIIITHDLAKLRSENLRVKNGFLPVLAVLDLIKMKTEAGRPQDLEDVKTLKRILHEKNRKK